MDIALRSGLSFCIASDRAIFLDLPQNRYFCLSPRANDAFIAMADGVAAPSERAQLESQLPADLLAAKDQWIGPPKLPDWKPVTRSLIDRQTVRPGKIATFNAVVYFVLARSSIRLFSLARIISTIERRKAAVSPKAMCDRPDLTEIVAAYEQSSVHIARHDRCLPRSIAMTRHLLSAGIVPTLVFAVMVRPFQAHCWVQYEDQLLNDQPETIRNFTPILIV
jgi:hypothetical protein